MIKHYFGLVKFSHTIFALPFALASLFYAQQGIPKWQPLILMLCAMTFCRNTAMAFNRLADSKIDLLNPRTKNRHLPQRILSKNQVLIFVLINITAFIFTTYFINTLAFTLSIPTLALVCGYSYFKRFTSISQFILGLSLGVSPIGAWIVIKNEINLFPIWLGIILLLWVAGFDIIYATQDYEFDKKQKLHSVVTRLGIHSSLQLVKLLHTIMFLLALGLGFYFSLSLFYYTSLFITFILLLYLHFICKDYTLDRLNQRFFLANAGISVSLSLGIILSIL